MPTAWASPTQSFYLTESMHPDDRGPSLQIHRCPVRRCPVILFVRQDQCRLPLLRLVLLARRKTRVELLKPGRRYLALSCAVSPRQHPSPPRAQQQLVDESEQGQLFGAERVEHDASIRPGRCGDSVSFSPGRLVCWRSAARRGSRPTGRWCCRLPGSAAVAPPYRRRICGPAGPRSPSGMVLQTLEVVSSERHRRISRRPHGSSNVVTWWRRKPARPVDTDPDLARIQQERSVTPAAG